MFLGNHAIPDNKKKIFKGEDYKNVTFPEFLGIPKQKTNHFKLNWSLIGALRMFRCLAGMDDF